MSIMDKIFGSFGNNQQQPAPQQQQIPQGAGAGNPGNIPPQSANAATPGNGTVPAAGANPPANNEPPKDQSPLDAFSDLWKNEPIPEGQQQAPNMFNVDPQKLMEAASKVDFAKVITPDQMQAITAGGEGAVKAFAESMNKVSQAVYAQSAMASTKIVEQAIKQAETKFAEQVPALIKKHQVSDSLRTENPALSHPAAQPLIQALESQLTVKFPSATVAEIRQMATDYISSFASAAIPKKEEPASKSSKKETDWSGFLS